MFLTTGFFSSSIRLTGSSKLLNKVFISEGRMRLCNVQLENVDNKILNVSLMQEGRPSSNTHLKKRKQPTNVIWLEPEPRIKIYGKLVV